MPPKSKIKSAAPKNIHRNAPERKMHFLLGEKVVFWLLVMMTVALVTAIFGNVDVKSLKLVAEGTGANVYTPRISCDKKVSACEGKVRNLVIERDALANYQEDLEPIIELMTSSTAPSIDGRKMISRQLMYQGYNDGNPLFHYQWNSATSTKTVRVAIPEAGIQFDAPYNDKWGNAYFSVAPYEKQANKDGVTDYFFGLVRYARGEGGGGFIIQYSVSVQKLIFFEEVEIKTEADLLAYLKEKFRGGVMAAPDREDIKITTQRINGLLVARVDLTVSCEDGGMGPCGTFTSYYVVGPDQPGPDMLAIFEKSYWFPDNFREFQNVIRSIRPLK